MLLASEFTDEAVAWSTVVLAAFTVVLVGFNLYQATLTKQALDQARKGTQEAIKARIDQRAPLIVTVAAEGGEPTRSWNQSNNSCRQLRTGDDLGNDDQAIGLTGWFRVENQGRSSGILRVPAGVLVCPRASVPKAVSDISEARPLNPIETAIAPNDGRLLFVQSTKTVAEWKAHWTDGGPPPEDIRCEVELLVEDTFREGVTDRTRLFLSGIPITPRQEESPVRWVGLGGLSKLVVDGTVRDHNIE
jgi:hypothetical protein